MELDVQKPTFIDLFAGCGGLSLGLSWAGWKGVLAIENDEMAFDTLQHNMLQENQGHFDWPGSIPQKALDVHELLSTYEQELRDLRGEITLLAGGPPCQGFSVAGARNGEDDRNSLVEAFLESASILEPPFLLIENVEGMTRPFQSKPRGEKKVSVEEEVKRHLAHELGYLPFSRVLDASRFGVPQTRDRLFIFAINKSYLSDEVSRKFDIYKQTPLFSENPDAKPKQSALNVFEQMNDDRDDFLESKGLPTDRSVTVGEAMGDLATDDIVESPEYENFETCTYAEEPGSTYAEMMRDDVTGDDVADSHRFTNHGERVRSRYELIHRESEYGRVSREILEKTGTGKHRVVYLNPDEPAPTVTTSPGDFLHFHHPRIVTVREMARLQSFPDSFEFKGRYTINGPRRKHDRARVSQVGNAVPPLLAESIGRGLRKVIEAISSLEKSGKEVA